MRSFFTVLMMVLLIAPSSAFSQDIVITIDNGWTWISYPRADTMQLDFALSGITPCQGDIIKSQKEFSVYDTIGGWDGSLKQFTPGKGYMYRSNREESFSFVFPETVLPMVTTGEVSNITTESAICSGNVLSSGGTNLIARGLCWSTAENPTIGDSHSIDGDGLGEFEGTMTELQPYTTYYVRAYATNSMGTGYGEQVSFTTYKWHNGGIDGALPGLFTINSSNTKVYFSQGNLQYIGSVSTPYWKFAENQWEYLGDNGQGNNGQTVDRDLFGWGTSGYNHGAVCYQPWSTSTTNSNYYAYGSSGRNLNYGSGKADWGYNAISNGGNQENQWRTLTYDEWYYLVNTRSTSSGIRYAKARVNGINGLIIVPDNWSSSTYGLTNTNSATAAYNSNTITASVWTSTLEVAGCVFLAASGGRVGNSMQLQGVGGYYWSSTQTDSDRARELLIESDRCNTYITRRHYGRAVRLVRVVQ